MNTKAKRGGCPICGRNPEASFRPFCSRRCADIDLGRWFSERYVVTEPADPEEKPDLPGEGSNGED